VNYDIHSIQGYANESSGVSIPNPEGIVVPINSAGTCSAFRQSTTALVSDCSPIPIKCKYKLWRTFRRLHAELPGGRAVQKSRKRQQTHLRKLTRTTTTISSPITQAYSSQSK